MNRDFTVKFVLNIIFSGCSSRLSQVVRPVFLSFSQLSSSLLPSVYPEHPASQISLPGAVRERLRETEKKKRRRSLGAVSLDSVVCVCVVVGMRHRQNIQGVSQTHYLFIQKYLNYYYFFPLKLVVEILFIVWTSVPDFHIHIKSY